MISIQRSLMWLTVWNEYENLLCYVVNFFMIGIYFEPVCDDFLNQNEQYLKV